MSRKLDALVAEHVMGLEVSKKYLFIDGWDGTSKWVDDPNYVGDGYIKTEDYHYYYLEEGAPEYTATKGLVPKYSTDIAAAWEVVEKMGLYGLEMGGIGDYVATFVIPGTSNWVSVEGRTQEEAICLAALEAKGVKIEPEVQHSPRPTQK